jgi:hypothetical protein
VRRHEAIVEDPDGVALKGFVEDGQERGIVRRRAKSLSRAVARFRAW